MLRNFISLPSISFLPAISFLLLQLLLSVGVFAQNPPRIEPGNEQIQGSKIQPFHMITDWGTQAVTLGKVQGRDVINVVIQLEASSGELFVDHIVIDRQSLGLLFRFAPYFAVGQDYLVATLQGSQLGGSLNPLAGGEPLLIGKELDSPVFEESLLGFTLAALPLAEGFQATLPRLAVSGSTKEFLAGSVGIEVKHRERIKAGDRKHYDTWVVEAVWGGVDYRETLWVADQPPYLIKKTATFPNGNTRTSDFKKVELPK